MATKEELQNRASELDIEGRSSMSKEELETAISDAEGTTDTGPTGPSESDLDNSLQAWWSSQIAAGASADDLDSALSSFEPTGPVGFEETKASSVYGHYAVAVEAIPA